MLIEVFALLAHMARARLRDRHQENLRRKLEVLKAEQGVEVEAGTEIKQELSSESSDEIEEKSEAKEESEGSE